jgi:hypothetical protein
MNSAIPNGIPGDGSVKTRPREHDSLAESVARLDPVARKTYNTMLWQVQAVEPVWYGLLRDKASAGPRMTGLQAGFGPREYLWLDTQILDPAACGWRTDRAAVMAVIDEHVEAHSLGEARHDDYFDDPRDNVSGSTGRWLREAVHVDPEGTPAGTLYEHYRAFCGSLGAEPDNATPWGRQLSQAGYLPVRTRTGKRRPLRPN